MPRRLLPILIAALLAAPVGLAAECRQEQAVYRDATGAYELAFAPVSTDADSATHRFTVRVIKTALVLDGHVMATEPVARSYGMLFNHCPEGDVTGDDIAACTVWQGVVYGHVGGAIVSLPAGAAPAAGEILLADFGPALRQSSAWGSGKASTVPFDVFSLTGCPT